MPQHRIIINFANLLDRINFDWNTCCWHWTGHKSAKGYGRTSFCNKRVSVHRLSKFLYGEMTAEQLANPNIVVMHSCDKPDCINPEHLRLGTHTENIADRDAKGRGKIGEHVWNAKLTATKVRALRIDRTNGISSKALAVKYKVGISTIKRVLSGETWNHIK